MEIEWLGHSCFLLTAESGARLVTDPYDTSSYPGSLLYLPLDETPAVAAEVVTLSHTHADHGNAGAIAGNPEVLRSPELHQLDGLKVRGVRTFHDTQQGDSRGPNIVFVIEADGLRICHLGDLGHELSDEQAGEIGPVDVLFIPVGGFFTIDAAVATRVWRQLQPALTIPMHYRNDKCHFNIEGVDPFTEGKSPVETPRSSRLTVKKDNLPPSPKIVVLQYSR